MNYKKLILTMAFLIEVVFTASVRCVTYDFSCYKGLSGLSIQEVKNKVQENWLPSVLFALYDENAQEKNEVIMGKTGKVLNDFFSILKGLKDEYLQSKEEGNECEERGIYTSLPNVYEDIIDATIKAFREVKSSNDANKITFIKKSCAILQVIYSVLFGLSDSQGLSAKIKCDFDRDGITIKEYDRFIIKIILDLSEVLSGTDSEGSLVSLVTSEVSGLLTKELGSKNKDNVRIMEIAQSMVPSYRASSQKPSQLKNVVIGTGTSLFAGLGLYGIMSTKEIALRYPRIYKNRKKLVTVITIAGAGCVALYYSK